MLVTSVLILLLTTTVLCVVPTPPIISGVELDGVDIINFQQPALGYASNLRGPAWNQTTLFFTADEGSPNLFTVQVKEGGGLFASTGKSYFADLQLSPFMDLDVFENNQYKSWVIGIVYPSNTSDLQNNFGTQIQAVYAHSYNQTENKVSSLIQFDGYTFHSVIFDQSGGAVPNTFYVTGRANDPTLNVTGFFVARGTIDVTANPPTLELRIDQDLASNILTNNCFDFYDMVKKPQMWISQGYLYLAVVGRCAAITKCQLGQAQFKNTQWITPLILAPTENKYLSAVDLNTEAGVLYYIVQDYKQRATIPVSAFNVVGWLPMNTVEIDGGGQSDVLMRYTRNQAKMLYVVASGANKIFQFNTDDNGVGKLQGTAVIPDSTNQISSLFYIAPHLYWTTYSRDAVVARVHSANFCSQTCSAHSYCNKGFCTCQSDWAPVQNATGTICVNKVITENEKHTRDNKATATALFVLFALNCVSAAVGWYKWHAEGRAA